MSRPGWIDEPLYTKIKQIMPIPCVDLLIIHNGRLLLMKRKNPPAKGLWFTPGGRIFKGESLKEAVKRVLFEETGLIPASITQCDAMSHNWGDVHTVTIFHKVIVDSAIITMNSEHEDYMWINKIEDSLHPYLLHMIEKSNIFDLDSNY